MPLDTAEVEPFEFELDGYNITLIDTPGFNDTSRSEAEVLTSIANYLDYTYRNPPHLKLNGIIYLQSIMDPRMYGSSLRNLKMFKDLCGENPMKNVVLVTNRWEYASSCGEAGKALEKEGELRTKADFWAPLIKRGSDMVCWEDNYAPRIQYTSAVKDFLSAHDIIRRFINKEPKVLQIQTELVEQQRKLIDTTAGVTVNEETLRVEKKYQDELVKIRQEMEEAKAAADLEVQEALEQSKKDYERKLNKLQDEQDLLRYERRNERRRMNNEIEDLKEAYQKQIDAKLGAQKVDFEQTVQTLMANQEKLREEQRRMMQIEIDNMRKKPKEKRSVSGLILGLIPTIGGLALSAMGIPVGLFGGLESLLGGC